VFQRQSAVIGRDPGRRIRCSDLMQRLQKPPPEVADAVVTLAELLVQRIPVHELRLARGNPVQPLGEPDIDAEGH